MHKKYCSVFILSGFIILFSLSFAFARTKVLEPASNPSFSLQKALAEPCSEQRTHRVAKYCFTLTNWGFIGSQSRDQDESAGGCFNPCGANECPKAPSFEFPCGTDMEYLFQGALWIGAVVEGETLVSVGADGWLGVYEMYPDPAPDGCIKEKSIRPSTPNCTPPDTAGAISEQDIIGIYADTSVYLAPPDDWDGPHRPIGIQVVQRSYSWSYDYAEDFALIDFTIKNIGNRDIKNIWIGLYIDADVSHFSLGAKGSQDDITGFRAMYPSPFLELKDTLTYQDTINTAWIADDNGDLTSKGVPDAKSVTSVTGVRVVRAPTKQVNFNWWVSWGYAPLELDWGPQKEDNWDTWIKNYQKWCDGSGQKGTPCGDRAKYYSMSNGEYDYDQIYACEDRTAEGWLPPQPDSCATLANGYDTRYLFSFGPITRISVGDSQKVTVGYIAGENFHVKTNPIDPNNPDVFYNNLDFSDFATNSRWAGWVYDNPGVDTPDPVTGDTDGYKGRYFIHPESGDTIYYEGDSIPDFKGPPPPYVPVLSFANGDGYIKVKWNGKKTEFEGVDPFTGVRDFEGYRIYMSYTGLANDWTLLASFDYVDYKMWRLKPISGGYDTVWLDEGIRPHIIEKYFGKPLADTLEKNPNKYTGTATNSYVYLGPPDTLKIPGKWYTIAKGDKLFFGLQDWNRGLRGLRADTTGYVDYVDRVNTDTISTNDIPDSLIEDKYYECEYTQTGLLPTFPVFIAVTAFDYGNARTNLGGLEAAKSINSTMVFPMDSPAKNKENRAKVVVLPNPYKISENYQRPYGREPGPGQFQKRLYFYKLQGKCWIRVYTLDGDLVWEKYHDSESNPTDEWNLINRNTQAVVSGIYLYSVEYDSGESQVGKFVIIK